MTDMDDQLKTLLEDIKAAVIKYLETQPKDVRVFVNINRDCATDRSLIVMCPNCHRTNRLLHGTENAICGVCKAPLPRFVPADSSKVN